MLLSTESTKMQAAKVEAVSLKVATTYLGGGVPARKDIHSERKDFNMDSGFGRFYQWFLERNSGSILGSIVARVEVMCPAPIHMSMAKKLSTKLSSNSASTNLSSEIFSHLQQCPHFTNTHTVVVHFWWESSFLTSTTERR